VRGLLGLIGSLVPGFFEAADVALLHTQAAQLALDLEQLIG